MTIHIYINGQPAESYTAEEMADIRKKLTVSAMKAAGFVPADGSTSCRNGNDTKLPA